MTEQHRQRLLVARAFAGVFIDWADYELSGVRLKDLGDAQPNREEAAEQLKAALEALESED